MSALELIAFDTPEGRIYLQWDHSAMATPNAQLVFLQSVYKLRICIKGGVRCLTKGGIDISVRRSNKSKKSTEPFQDVLFPDEKV